MALGHSLCHFEDNWAFLLLPIKTGFELHTYICARHVHTLSVLSSFGLCVVEPLPCCSVWPEVPRAHMQKVPQHRTDDGAPISVLHCYTFLSCLLFSFSFFPSLCPCSFIFPPPCEPKSPVPVILLFLFILFFSHSLCYALRLSALSHFHSSSSFRGSFSSVFCFFGFLLMSHVHPHSSACFCMHARTHARTHSFLNLYLYKGRLADHAATTVYGYTEN